MLQLLGVSSRCEQVSQDEGSTSCGSYFFTDFSRQVASRGRQSGAVVGAERLNQGDEPSLDVDRGRSQEECFCLASVGLVNNSTLALAIIHL